MRRLAVFEPMAMDCCGRLRCVPTERLWASAGGAVMLVVDGASDRQWVSEVLTQLHVTGIELGPSLCGGLIFHGCDAHQEAGYIMKGSNGWLPSNGEKGVSQRQSVCAPELL